MQGMRAWLSGPYACGLLLMDQVLSLILFYFFIFDFFGIQKKFIRFI